MVEEDVAVGTGDRGRALRQHPRLDVEEGRRLQPVLDLALVRGIPSFTQVLDAVLAEIVVEGSTAAAEARGSDVDAWLEDRGLQRTRISHEDLKGLLPEARLIIRTGEATPYANIVLQCGVDF